MVVHPEATGLQASNYYYYLHDISTFIGRSTTAFKIHVGDLTTRTAMFVGCSSGNAAANVWTGAVGRTFDKRTGRKRQHKIGDNAECYGLIMFELNVRSVVASGEVMNGQASPLSPEHTVTIPLSDYPFTDTVRARGLNCGGGRAVPRADGRFVIYIGLYGNRGDNPHAPLPVPRNCGGQAYNTNAVGSETNKGQTWKKRTCKECKKGDNEHAGALNSDQLDGKCVAVFEKKQKAKKNNGGFAPIWVPGALRPR